MHEAFVAVIESAARYRPGQTEAKLWLLGIARNHARRARAVRRTLSLHDEERSGASALTVECDPASELDRRATSSHCARPSSRCRCGTGRSSCCATSTSSATPTPRRLSDVRWGPYARGCIAAATSWRGACAALTNRSRVRFLRRGPFHDVPPVRFGCDRCFSRHAARPCAPRGGVGARSRMHVVRGARGAAAGDVGRASQDGGRATRAAAGRLSAADAARRVRSATGASASDGDRRRALAGRKRAHRRRSVGRMETRCAAAPHIRGLRQRPRRPPMPRIS